MNRNPLVDMVGAMIYRDPGVPDSSGMLKRPTFLQTVANFDLANYVNKHNTEMAMRPILAQQEREIKRGLAMQDVNTMPWDKRPTAGDFGAPQANQQTDTLSSRPLISTPVTDTVFRPFENYGTFTSGLPTKANVFNRDLTNREKDEWVSQLLNPALRNEPLVSEQRAGAILKRGLIAPTAITQAETENILANTGKNEALYQARTQEDTQHLQDLMRLNSTYWASQGVPLDQHIKLAQMMAQDKNLDAQHALDLLRLQNDTTAEHGRTEDLKYANFSRSTRQKLQDALTRRSLYESQFVPKQEQIYRKFLPNGMLSGNIINPNFVSPLMEAMAATGNVPPGIANGIVDKKTGQPVPIETDDGTSLNANKAPTATPPVVSRKPVLATGENPVIAERIAYNIPAISALGSKIYDYPETCKTQRQSELESYEGKRNIPNAAIRTIFGGLYPSAAKQPINALDIALEKVRLKRPLTTVERQLVAKYQGQ